ncbi:MAG: hypothetical protein ACRELF_05980, partial [Gemmataceae bacterium]
MRPCLEILEDRITPTTFTPAILTDPQGATNSLRGVITQANADTGTATDTIQLGIGTYGLSLPNTAGHDVLNASGDLNINSENHGLIIQGVTDANGNPLTVIDQRTFDRVFQILNPADNPEKVIFRNLVIEGGNAQDNGGDDTPPGTTDAEGGGIMVDGGGFVTLSNVVLTKNTAQSGDDFSAQGGGIYVLGGSLNIQSSTIQNNSVFVDASAAKGDGEAASGGGVYGSHANISISSST